MTFNADSAILINQYHLDKSKFRIYFSSAVVVFFVASSIVFLSYICLIRALDTAIGFDFQIMSLLFMTCFFFFFSRVNLNMWQRNGEVFKYGIFQVALTFIKNGLMLVAIFYFIQYSWKGIIYAQFIAQAIFFIYSVYYLISNNFVSNKINKAYIKDSIKIGSSLTFHQLGAWSGNLATRFILFFFLGAAAAGQFGIAATFGLIIALIMDSLNKAFVPYLFDSINSTDYIKNPGNLRRIVKLTYAVNAGILLTSIFISLFGVVAVERIFGSQYAQSKSIIIWLTFASAFNGMYKMHVNYMFYTKEVRKIASITVSTGVLNILLSVILIYLNGLQGAAQAYCISQCISFIFSWYLGNRVFPMPWFKSYE